MIKFMYIKRFRELVSERRTFDNSKVHKLQALYRMSSFIIWLLEIVVFDFRFNLNGRLTQHFTYEFNGIKRKLILN